MERSVKFQCGHEATMTVVGRIEDAEQQIRALEQFKCKKCRSESNPKTQGFVHMAAEPKKPTPKKKEDDEDEPEMETEGQTGPPPKPK